VTSTGRASQYLDCWLSSTDECRAQLSEAYASADFVLAEGCFPRHETADDRRGGDLAKLSHRLDLPRVIILDAALAAGRRTKADIDEMNAALAAMRTAPYGSVAWLKNDLEFHRAVAEATRNAYMGQFLVFVSERVRESILAAGNQQKSDDMARTTLGEHERILAAIVAGDVEEARTAMQDHLAGAACRVGLTAIDSSPQPAKVATGRKVAARNKPAASGNAAQ